LNLKMSWDYGYKSNEMWRARMEEVFGDPSTWFEKHGIGSEKGLFWPHRSQTPQDPRKGREYYREGEALCILGKVDLYQMLANQLMFKLANLVKNDGDARESPVRNVPAPVQHQIGDIVSAPNALGDSFYADADLETIRLNGTAPRASPNFPMSGKKIPVYPVIWGPDVLAKLQANGGSFTDAEFKALPEYGSPDLNHFPLATNLTYWHGTDNCPHVYTHYDGPEFPEGSLRITPACRIREPTDKHLDWLGLVHKKNHSQTGETMLVWNPVHFSDEDFSDGNVLAPGSALWPLGKTLEHYQKQAMINYPHKRLLQGFYDILLNNGNYFGSSWINNPYDRPVSLGTVWYSVLWHWYQLPFLFEVKQHVDNFDFAADLAMKASNKRAFVNKKFYVNKNITCLLMLGFTWVMIWDAKKKRDSEES